jgi:hypothetical protein
MMMRQRPSARVPASAAVGLAVAAAAFLAGFLACRAQYSGCSEYPGGTVPVGSLPAGASWCGALDLLGNAVEWVADWYGPYPASPRTNPTGPEIGDAHVLRGGSWYNNPYWVYATNREGGSPTAPRIPTIGFRCARPAERASSPLSLARTGSGDPAPDRTPASLLCKAGEGQGGGRSPVQGGNQWSSLSALS